MRQIREIDKDRDEGLNPRCVSMFRAPLSTSSADQGNYPTRNYWLPGPCPRWLLL